ncbi:PIG-L family deacetylase [Pseudomonas sp. NPDC087697]|uniref:PIG-L family deacetylase n=1 Tax=Pseudomonas sp. NPDC087697 TaxID=3364447 RepID=UPI0037F4906F
MKLINTLAIACTLLALSTHSFAASTTFYIVAHQDDWQLFMGAHAHADVNKPGNNTVFIYITAGDEGFGTGIGHGAQDHPYYLAREEGANRAVRFMANDDKPRGEGKGETITINGKSLYKYSYEKTISYFLRLPDGKLRPFYLGEIKTITAINDTATYSTWNDLVKTIESIITTEGRGSAKVVANYPNKDEKENPENHPDHITTALAVDAALAGLSCVDRRTYIEYSTRFKPTNLSSTDQITEAAIWATTASGLSDMGYRSTYNSFHNDFIGKIYYSSIDGTGDCAFR